MLLLQERRSEIQNLEHGLPLLTTNDESRTTNHALLSTIIPMRVSVIIPTHNYGGFLEAAIESVLEQTHQADEIIVVDDGSTDDTPARMKGFAAPVRYIRQENSGVSVARNRGVAESTGDLIAFLDADDYWESTCLETAVAKFESRSDIGLVHWGLREFDSSTGETIGFYLDGGEQGVAENLLLWEGAMIAGHGAVVVTREAYDYAGPFDTATEPSEDWDFCYRVTKKFGVAFVPEPLVNYRSHSAGAHRDISKMDRGMTRFYEKAFDTDDESVLKLRRRAYGNFHKVMAGSYFYAGRYGSTLSHAAKSIWMNPVNVGYFLKFPLRRLTTRPE
jgi:glycosyltransferase involved in cell wall biosynthesis